MVLDDEDVPPACDAHVEPWVGRAPEVARQRAREVVQDPAAERDLGLIQALGEEEQRHVGGDVDHGPHDELEEPIEPEQRARGRGEPPRPR